MFFIYGPFSKVSSTTKVTKIPWIKLKKRCNKISHVFDIAHDVILKLNIGVGRWPTRYPPPKKKVWLCHWFFFISETLLLLRIRALKSREARMVTPAMGAAMIDSMCFLWENRAQHGGHGIRASLLFRAILRVYFTTLFWTTRFRKAVSINQLSKDIHHNRNTRASGCQLFLNGNRAGLWVLRTIPISVISHSLWKSKVASTVLVCLHSVSP